ncbi:hypothetical protein VNO78_32745 [Psophocarpus tetragonolobus]|uniref:Response regulatory domain-containing protein n=1 Tax=Psophocarpus tetragonolobus TaxID=3891 RepID=A0AAN9RKR9_PSOTE
MESAKKMACDKVDINVLVVDDDNTSLTIVADILKSLGYNVLTANGALNALETLREFEGVIDLIVTELHLSGMNEFEFQKRVEDEFHVPVIITSADSRTSVISKSLANGASHYILKPCCTDDFKDIWNYATASRKRKLTIGNNEGEPQPGSSNFIQDYNYATSSNVKKKRKSSQVKMEGQREDRSRLGRKPKIVWTPYLHNLFLFAIKQIGFDKVGPKRILEIMNVPHLTQENVSSHLQKFRIFLRKVAKKGLRDGLSKGDKRSIFSNGLSETVIKDFQQATTKTRVVQQNMKRIENLTGNRGIANAVKPNNHVSRSPYVTNTPLGRCHQFGYPSDSGLNMMLHNQHGNSLNHARLGVRSCFGTNVEQKMVGSYENRLYYAKGSSSKVGAVFPLDGPREGVKYGVHQLMYPIPNHGSKGNNRNFSYGQGNWNMGSLNNSWTTSSHNPSSDIQLNGGSQMAGNEILEEGFNSNVSIMDSIANSNNFGLINATTQNENNDVATSGSAERGFASASSAGECWSSELAETLLSNNGTIEENIPRNAELPHQPKGNVAETDNTATIGEGNISHKEDDLSDLFKSLDGMDLLSEVDQKILMEIMQ